MTAPRGKALPHDGQAPDAGAWEGGGGAGGATGFWTAAGGATKAAPGTTIGELQAGQLICEPA